ncbi:TORTIFOLIA1-like protein 3 [Mangifera indica]|uniref:TORTIFOLIA1-like protein 3 n=1 Tax=Mangifera indica TaxID=29780 RepID=UPI001CFAA944|nr:TORTIFOLIA1-like protein 3 [Mangifera indica]XP_044476244.1 TORTIFOLIA1-like protein 3 [Mangifera indica]XP_044476245.1 TORTIFOLIA1-like protein 3 [Mangifera indica]XP_044476246.1 TORTIFOLIA1-like protein 3 [Mangifera indica]
MAQPLKLRVYGLLTKLSDRDTYSQAATELESIASTLESALLPTFLSCILSTNSSDRLGVRKECTHVITTLSSSHNLSPYVTKIVNNLTRNFRDKNSSIQATCISTISSLSSRVTASAFVTILKLLSDALFTEQDMNAQVGAALCLAAAIDAAPDPDAGRLGRLLARLERLVKNERFKAKAAALVVVGSVIGSGAAGGEGLKGLISCLLGFLSSDDWAVRKAAAEGLWRLAAVEKDSVAEFKANCLKVSESRRFDKVKAVREVMNQMIEAWKQVPDIPEVSQPLQSHCLSKENASDGRYLVGPNNFTSGLELQRKSISAGKSTPPDGSFANTVRKRGPFKKTSQEIFQKLEHKKPSNWKVEISVPGSASLMDAEDDVMERDGNASERRKNEKTRPPKPDTKRALFNKSSDDRMHKFGGLRSGSRVVPCHEESRENTLVFSDNCENLQMNHKDCEDLSLIRNQLVQIENQQSSLLDLLQRFIGSSQTGMHSLETRVHGLELALDGISYDLAVSTGRMTDTDSQGTTCCLLPGAEFLSSKFWRKTESRSSTSRFTSSGGTSSCSAMHHRTDINGNSGTLNLQNRKLRYQGGGFIVNPLAEICTDSRGVSEVAHQ